MLLGAAVALLYAPSAGADTRRRLARWLGQVQTSLEHETGSAAAADSARGVRPRSASGRFAPQAKRESTAE
jgi:gas vesicle protein